MASDKKAKTVRLDNDVMETLAKSRQSWESPSDCLKRILSKNPCGTKDHKEPDEVGDEIPVEE